MGMFIGSVPGKNPDGVTIVTNSNGLLAGSLTVIKNTSDSSLINAPGGVLGYTITVPFTLANTDVVEIRLFFDNTVAGRSVDVRTFDGSSETTITSSPLSWSGSNLTTIVLTINLNSTTYTAQQIFTNAAVNPSTVTATITPANITQFRVYGYAGAGNYNIKGYEMRIFRDI